MLIVDLMVGVCSLLGLPWCVAATVLCLGHVDSLKVDSESRAPGETPVFVGVREQRVTGTCVFILTGLLIGWFVVGSDVKHSLYAILTTFIILLAAGGTLTSVIISFIFNFGYLLVGYYYTESEGYDICWTMPHCVLTLRLIGLSFDCYDGDKSRRHGRETLSKDQQKTALESPPSLLEMMSHSFFVGGYLVGPQFSMKKFQEFASPVYQDSLPSSPLSYGLKRLGLSFCYMLVHLVGGMFVPQDWPSSQHFHDSCFITKCLLLGPWMKFTLSK